AKSMLNKLGITNHHEVVDHLSGGQKKRVALASVLLSTADLLILDEPTNHLDSEMAEWLEEYLKKFRGALLMITHDRYFLDSVTNCIVELDNGKLYRYQANYEGFLELKAERMDMERASERKRQSILRVELEWVKRGARARTTKQKGRLQRYEDLKNQKGPTEELSVEMESVSSRLGRTTVELSDICKAYGDKVLIKDYTYFFLKNDRIGYIGPNGSGKSTLMKIIAGWEKPDSGTIEIGQTVKMGYFSQENEDMDTSLKVIDYIKNVAEYVKTKDGSISASQMLERFLFPPSVQYTVIGKLSGGERRRLYLLKILMDAPNVLILDEPTNDLDIKTLMILEDYLDSFQGIVITVSHDRYFLDRVVRRIFAFEGDGVIRQYEGGFTDYQIKKEAEMAALGETAGSGAGAKGGKAAAAANAAEPAKKTEKPREKKLKFTYMEQREWDTIEDDMAALEDKIADLDAQIAASATNYGKLRELMAAKEETEAKLEEKMERWMYLNDLAEKIAEQNK
ncbi:MAG: ABC-F family ATP-binding cassette domain-containing protein, partial [Lachnospiraceae bacterium]|nr:ABC-F family ATP-binding cassette domain-containing protein [Lachnospiraceae bacterium]